MQICFELTMPNRGSWNGRWSGEDSLWAVIRSVTPKTFATLKSSYYYRWEDGWGARITLRQVKGSEIRSIRKRSQGFCGYEWMIDSILRHGAIYAPHQIPKQSEVSA